jgi:hypothetical protein
MPHEKKPNLGNEMSLIDAHVHLYGVFDLHLALDSAARNFQYWKERLGCSRSSFSVLLLAEAGDDDVFTRLQSGSLPRQLRRWSVSETGEPISLALTRDDGEQLILVAGRQVTTPEGIELLALACTAQPTRLPLLEGVAFISEHGGLPVLPWGFGKWIGRRGKIVERILGSSEATGIALGDTSYRPRTGRLPPNFRKARDHRIPIYPGTDPLPFAGQESVIGSYGFVLRRELDPTRPGHSLLDQLSRSRGPVEPFGAREALLPNLSLQFRMQALKLRRRKASRRAP